MILIAMRTSNIVLAALCSMHLGAILGVLPFNYPPSKIFSGFGALINGFMFAVLSILIGSKLAVSIIILGLPIIDALWVMSIRIRNKFPEVKRNPLKILRIVMSGDNNHLHHRLLGIGFSWKGVAGVEFTLMAIFSFIAFALSGFRDEFVVLVGVLDS